MTKQITVIVKKPGEDAFVTQIDKSLKSMQAVVGGSVERTRGSTVGLPHKVEIWCNEEGILHGLEPNLHLVYQDDVGGLLGTVFFASFISTKDGEETASLPEIYHQQVLDYCKASAWRGR